MTAELEPIEVLRARVGLSVARMYLVDLENKADFGRMVDVDKLCETLRDGAGDD